MSWQLASLVILALVLASGFVWFERSRPPARIVAAVAAMAALGVAGRLALAPIPNVVATTDVALLAGYALGGGPGFAVGALSGLVSNFWLGQGPWTPWQMAGWGLVGIAGALLAKASGRRMGRWSLAVCGALAGLAYGALLDLSVMVSFGGEQSLERYLALSARGLPFNIAHAAGNFILMATAGPAIVRMLDRYRGRFEYRWSDAPLPVAMLAAVLVAFAVAALVAPSPGVAAGDREAARGWLERAQNSDGGYGTEPASTSSVEMTGWAMLGLEAAGTNPRDLDTGGTSPVEYLRENAAEITSTADLERTILALEGAGVDSRAFEGRDLVAELRDRLAGDGSFERQVNLTAFGILAQRAAGVEGGNVGPSAAWLRGAQNRNGGWGSAEGAESEPDSTGSVLQALAVSPGGGEEIADGARWLEQAQRAGGGWSLTSGAPPNTQSTAWAIQGLIAAGRSPGAVRNNGRSGADFILSRQGEDGHYAYSSSSDQTPVWVTAQGLTGVAQQAFPIAAVPREPPEPEPSTPGYGGGSFDDYSGVGSSGGYDSGVYDGGPGSFGTGGFGAAGGAGGAESGPGASPGSGSGGANDAAAEATPRVRIPASAGASSFASAAAQGIGELPSQDSPLPSTLAFVAGLGLLAAALGAGFVRLRRRLS